ncbi:hypothetical protein ACO1LU_14565, partial [Staphylococcus aureus]
MNAATRRGTVANASFRPDFQRTRASHRSELAMFFANASDRVLDAVSLDTLDRRHGGKGGLPRKEIECALIVA